MRATQDSVLHISGAGVLFRGSGGRSSGLRSDLHMTVGDQGKTLFFPPTRVIAKDITVKLNFEMTGK